MSIEDDTTRLFTQDSENYQTTGAQFKKLKETFHQYEHILNKIENKDLENKKTKKMHNLTLSPEDHFKFEVKELESIQREIDNIIKNLSIIVNQQIDKMMLNDLKLKKDQLRKRKELIFVH
jgi:hypothetical protein